MARIGMVNYINTAPIYEIWKERVYPDSWKIIEGQPSALNEMLAGNEIDLGFVSSYAYSLDPKRYQILAGLSISATGPVDSVLLLSSIPPQELGGKLVLLTGQSGTSVCLVRIILEEFFGIQPAYITGNAYTAQQEHEDVAAVLAIGDDALRMTIENRYPYRLDLSQHWYEETGLPFVFSVCAIRQEFIDTHPDDARAIRQAFVDCRKVGAERMPEICDRVARRIPMDCEMCSRYLHGIEHNLSPAKIAGLERFYQILIQRNEADAETLPLKIFE
ncbi:menaquinone biosynthetic enzyme MqnA/MqnD family protein [Desulfogranum japonicum]|uniref:menaquinone biosynthetic enzyme MqnA/MqnD family protein n=1 Tax=Desulfogranum japonicum TaxID=231447 RepID=UPI0004096AD7|nr:menaquinone biosynthesis protein [Desulfogranum japonicum]